MADDVDIPELASELRLVVGQLVRRFRADRTLPLPQTTALALLGRHGPLTTSRLAMLEHVRPQSMAHTVAELEAAGLVQRRADPSDRRQTLIELTAAGTATNDEYRRIGEQWVASGLRDHLDEADRAALARSIELMRRLLPGE